jgi:hypothetical protein
MGRPVCAVFRRRNPAPLLLDLRPPPILPKDLSGRVGEVCPKVSDPVLAGLSIWTGIGVPFDRDLVG